IDAVRQVAVATAHHQHLSLTNQTLMLQLQINGVQMLHECAGLVTLGMIKICLHGQARPRSQLSTAPAEDIGSTDFNIVCIELVQPPAVSVALQGEAIMITFPVCPKARLASFPACAGGYPCGGLRIVMAAVLGVNPIEAIVGQFTAMAHGGLLFMHAATQ